MSEMSDYLEGSLITHIFRTSSWSKPSALAMCLLTTNADDDDTGVFSTSTGVEVTNANNYARASHATTPPTNPADGNWTAASAGNGQTSNVGAIAFNQCTTATWGTVVGLGITDNATYDSGNLLFFTPLDTSRAIDVGDTAEFAAGAITVTFA